MEVAHHLRFKRIPYTSEVFPQEHTVDRVVQQLEDVPFPQFGGEIVEMLSSVVDVPMPQVPKHSFATKLIPQESVFECIVSWTVMPLVDCAAKEHPDLSATRHEVDPYLHCHEFETALSSEC